MSADEDIGGWDEYRRLVLAELRRLNERLDTMDEHIGATRIEVARLQVKSGIWGGVAGVVSALSIVLVALATKLLKLG